MTGTRASLRFVRVALFLATLWPFLPAAADPLRVVATTPDLGDLSRAVAGDAVELTVLARGPQDPHFVEPRPSFIRALHGADALVWIGMELERGWLPSLLRSARNPDVMPGGSGSIDASTVIEPLEVPTTRVDRSMGDVHALGNPHYLTDPLNGLAVAALIRDRLTELRPGSAADFGAGYEAFAERLLEALVGERLFRSASAADLVAGILGGSIHEDPGLGGWLGQARGGTLAVQDHRLWPYFARRFRVELRGTLEPRPGIAPTTRHLATLVDVMRADGVRLVLSSVYFDARHARFVAQHVGGRVAEMAHQVGARPGTADYVATVEHNVREVFETP